VLPAEQLRPAIARRREQWRKYQGRLDPRRLVFVDETWAKTNMAPLRGWAPVGERLNAKVPYGHWRTMTFIAALRCDRVDAPFVFDQPINAASFTAWVEQELCPTLKRGDVVIMDNLSSHKKPAARAAIRATGARLIFLPPYSPDLNPIEQLFAKLKHLLRKGAERTHLATWQRIGTLLEAFSPQECANYLTNSGYASD
jgi:transposase